MSEKADSAIKSVVRVFEVLELFERMRSPLTLIKVGRALDYPASSALALLKSMVSLGYLSFDRIDRSYFPTMRLTLLVDWVERAVHTGPGSLTALADALIQATGESVSISCQNDLDMQFIYLAQGPQHITVNLAPGTLAPLFRSSIGLTALTMRPDEEILRLAARSNKATTIPKERVAPAAVLRTVEAIRQRGWFAGYDMYIDGIGAISFVLPTADSRRNMVLSISGPTERVRQNEARIVQATLPLLEDFGFLDKTQPKRRA